MEKKRYKIDLRLEDREDHATSTIQYETNDVNSLIRDLRNKLHWLETTGKIMEDMDL